MKSFDFSDRDEHGYFQELRYDSAESEDTGLLEAIAMAQIETSSIGCMRLDISGQ